MLTRTEFDCENIPSRIDSLHHKNVTRMWGTGAHNTSYVQLSVRSEQQRFHVGPCKPNARNCLLQLT